MLVTTTGVACAGAGSDDAPGGRIAFAIELDGGEQLVTVSADGGGDLTVLRDLSQFAGDDTKWSPDGKKIASNHLDVFWVMNADGTYFREVVETGTRPDFSFAWSPDGGQIAFLDHSRLNVEDADGTNRRAIVRCVFCEPQAQLAWSPDGSTIAYAEGVSEPGIGASTQIHLVHPDGTGKRVLARGGDGPAPEFSWSPDGKQLAFTRPPVPYVMGSDGRERDNPDKPVMYVINTDGSGERELDPGEGPVWSPEGARIAFTRGGIVHTINSDGSGERRLGRGDGPLSWSPSGTEIAVSRDVGRTSSTRKAAIWVLNADGSGGRQIWPREGVCECGAPTWLPD